MQEGSLLAGSDPLNPDSDGDGALDGEDEDVLQALADDDGDGLPNGFEIDSGLDPNNADTDGDGLKDGEDPDPWTPCDGEHGEEQPGEERPREEQ